MIELTFLGKIVVTILGLTVLTVVANFIRPHKDDNVDNVPEEFDF
jgi:hypothetical protein